jgi:hypothetical protein
MEVLWVHQTIDTLDHALGRGKDSNNVNNLYSAKDDNKETKDNDEVTLSIAFLVFDDSLMRLLYIDLRIFYLVITLFYSSS